MATEAPDNRTDTALIDGGSGFHDGGEIAIGGRVLKDIHLIREGYLRIRNDGRQQQGMGMPAYAADNPAYMETQAGVSGFDGAVIVTMNGEASGMVAGT